MVRAMMMNKMTGGRETGKVLNPESRYCSGDVRIWTTGLR
jgi:hypothetical protein